MGSPLLELKGISKRFGAVQALRRVDFEIRAGEVVALVGDNGAGKSTLIKILSGNLAIDEGEIRFEGRPVTLSGPQAASSLGIATVFQDLALCDNLDVVNNLFLGREHTRLGTLDELEMEQRAATLLTQLSVSIPSVRTQVAALSGGQRQSIAVARALVGAPRIVLLDEPTAALGVVQTQAVLELIRSLRVRGLGVVVISHNLADVFSVADRIAVLRLGQSTAVFDARAARHVEVVAAITGATQTQQQLEARA